jgi:hypothetical protein
MTIPCITSHLVTLMSPFQIQPQMIHSLYHCIICHNKMTFSDSALNPTNPLKDSQMPYIDSLKFEIPEEAVRHVDTSIFNLIETIDLDSGESRYQKWCNKPSSLPIGYGQLTKSEGKPYILSVSAKSLKDNYLYGITLDTLPQVMYGIKPIIDIDLNRLLESGSMVHTVDTTNNLPLDEIGGSLQQVIAAIHTMPMNARFQTVRHDRKGNQGIELRGEQSKKNRLIAYSKADDLLKAANKAFCSQLTNFSSMYQTASQQIRIEANHCNRSSIRDRFDIPEATLSAILNSTTSVNFQMMQKIRTKSRPVSPLQLASRIRKKNSKISYTHLTGMISIIRDADYDLKKIREILREEGTPEGTIRNMVTQGAYCYKKLIPMLRAEADNSDIDSQSAIVDRLMEMLRLERNN